MEAARWKQIDAIFDAVLEREPGQRDDFLNSICGSDVELRREVSELLQAYDKSEDFIETVAVEVAAKNFDADRIARTVARKIGSYEIDSLLGAGGMGEVYLAHDTKLNRRVALKILPAHFAAEAERLRRFKLEAAAVSALNHPNIVTIHDIGSTVEGEHFIATEFVEGQTLREIINDDKPPVLEILKIFVQICEALEAAHKAGIIHRDIKLENVMQRPDGLIKVLDFGLAKNLTAEQNENNSQNFAHTKNGIVVGTLNYLSPEQALGKALDARTDLWSLGVCLFEVLIGKPPFTGASQASVFNEIINSPPPIPTKINSLLPPEFDRIVAKALEKDPELRYQTASDFRADLRRLNKLIDASATWSNDQIKTTTIARTHRANWRSAILVAAAFLTLIGVVSLVVWQNSKINLPTAPDWSKAKYTQLTDGAGTEFFPSLAPDGKTFVYAGKDNGNFDLFVQRIGGKNTDNLTSDSPADDTQPAFSPSGELIAFRSEREPKGIYVIEATGENVRRVSSFGYHPSWSPDGREIVVSSEGRDLPDLRNYGAGSLSIINVETGAQRVLTSNDATQPVWSPNGKRIAYWFMPRNTGRHDIATISADGGEPTVITRDGTTNWNPVWSPDNKFLYFASDRSGNMSFWRVRIDETSGKALSEPEAIGTSAKFSRHLSFSHDGKRMIYVQTNNESNIQAAQFDQQAEKIVGEPFWITSGDREVSRPELAPDGRQFVMRLPRRTQDDIVLINRETGVIRDLTNDAAFDRQPRWSPDNKKIAFASDRSGTYEIWIIDADGTNLRQVTFNSESAASFPLWSPDSRQIIFRKGNRTFLLDLNKEAQANQSLELPEPKNSKTFFAWDWSPDGKRLTGMVNHGQVGYYSLETNLTEKISDLSGAPMWLSDNTRLVFANDGKVYLANVETKKVKELISLKLSDINSVGVSRDNNLLYYTVHTSENDVWMLDLK